MKNTTYRMLRRACAGAVLVSFAPLVLAQNTSSPPASASPQDQGAPAPPPAAPLTNDQASYLFGLTLGEQLHAIGIPDVQLDAVSRGVKDAMAGKKSFSRVLIVYHVPCGFAVMNSDSCAHQQGQD